MGPFSEEKQFQRAKAIEGLLERNPQLDDLTRAMWETKLKNLAMDEGRYNARVRAIFSGLTRSPLASDTWN
tara:strand:+ start:532 stop:744 length:213 start_codon:yes stop_codon:yes gene_type:complete